MEMMAKTHWYQDRLAEYRAFRARMSLRSFSFDLKTLQYSAVGRVQRYNDFRMWLSGWFLRLFAFDHLPDKHLNLGINLWIRGKHQKALQRFGRSESLRVLQAKALGKDVVLLPRNCAHLIGLMGHIDSFIKRKIVNGDSRTYYLLAPPSEIVNPDFLRYWEPYVTVVSDPVQLAEWASVESALTVNWNWVIPEGDTLYHVHQGMALTQKKWHEQGRKPLLTLSESHADLLRQQKKDWGLLETDWFVCLHVRSLGYHQRQEGRSQGFRNTAIEDYYPLIDAITARGGWVFRMGDPSAPPLDVKRLAEPARVIDYAHVAERCAALDVALAASCRLFISSPSGLHMVAKAFGVPALYVNFPLYKGFPHDDQSLFLPAFYFSHRKKRVLTIEEILSSNLVHADHQCHFHRARVSLQHVSSMDMVEALDEALDFSKGVFKTNAATQAFAHINRQYGTSIQGSLCHNFAEKHADRLGLRSAHA